MNADRSNPAPLEEIVLDVLSDVLDEPVAALIAEPILAVHDWDSVASLEVLAQLESQLGITLDLRSFHAARDVNDLVELARSAPRTEPASR